MESAMKKRIGIIALLMIGMVSLPLAAQQMAGMEAQKKTEQASHQGIGKVVSVDKTKLTVKLTHEAIKSLGWPGMTMDFKVADAALLDDLKTGDAVKFELGKDAKTGKWQITRITPRAKP